MNTINSLLKSRKFLVAMFDFITSVILFFVGHYGSPELSEAMQFLIGAIQVPFGILIASIAYEDGAEKGADVNVFSGSVSEKPADEE